MEKILHLYEKMEKGGCDARFMEIYGCSSTAVQAKRERFLQLIQSFENTFGKEREVALFSSPGRTEMGGNHTDHQHGRVLAAAVELDAIACVSPNETNVVRIFSEGYPAIEVDLSCLEPQDQEKETSAALVRGVAARFIELGQKISGFDACMVSNVLGGSGLSSSAAYEVLIGVIFNQLFCNNVFDAVKIAQIGQYAENVFFGKPCGLMDQLASASGGIVSIDFQNPEEPVIHKLDYDLSASGYTLCIIDSGADHADLTYEYAAIPEEMKRVAAFFGKEFLRDVDEQEFWKQIGQVRAKTGDRAVLRAIHFFGDNLRAFQQACALEQDNLTRFLYLVNQSGESSIAQLQNVSCSSTPQQQAVAYTIAVAQYVLGGKGAVRVHGGGFAGTVQAYVPSDMVEGFKREMETALHEGCCHFLKVRPVGGTWVV